MIDSFFNIYNVDKYIALFKIINFKTTFISLIEIYIYSFFRFELLSVK